MQRLVILWKPLVSFLGCAGIAGCHGMAKAPERPPAQNRIVSTVSSAPSGSGEHQTQGRLLSEAQHPRRAELVLASLEVEEGTARLFERPEAEAASVPLSNVEPEKLISSDELLTPSAQLPPIPDAGAKPLSLDDLQQLAVALNPTLRQANALLEQARGNWQQVGLYPNPTVQAQRGANNAPFDMFNVFVTQEIVSAKKLQLNRAVASCDIERARWQAESQRLRVFNDVQIRYVAALGAQRQVAVAEELLQISEEGVRIAEQLRAGEQSSEADVLQARLQRSQIQIVLRNARAQASATWKQLGNVIGWPDLPPGQLAGDLNDNVPELDWEFAWQRLVSDNPSLRAASARVAAAQAQVHREEKQPKPNLQLTGGYGRDFFSPQFPMYTLQFAITPPVFDRNQGNIAAAVGELRAAQSELVRLELSLRDGLTKAFQRYLAARNQVQTYRDAVLPLAEKNLSLALKRYEAGEFDSLRVLMARRDLFDARINSVKALTELRMTAIQIEGLMLTGGLDPVESNPTASNRAGQTNGAGL